MGTHIALLRGINVGGRNKLPMKDLAEIFEEAGCDDVRTYIQSGNVVFAAGKKLAARVPQAISAAISKQFGYEVPVVLRSAEQLATVVTGNPFAGGDVEEKRLHVVFLADEADPHAAEALDPLRAPSEELALAGAHIYLHLPDGVARTKLTNARFDRALDTVSTMRNWRTTKKLLELSAG
ncbi:MAG: DUF1697 domain-containing protein [Acidobacteriota bacterium]